MNLDDRIGELIDRTCGGCGEIIPESSPSADFCGERCQSRWHMSRSLVTRADRHPADAGLMQFASPEQMGRFYDESGQRLQAYHVADSIRVAHSATLGWGHGTPL